MDLKAHMSGGAPAIVMTPTEAFAAIDAGARDIKLFPGGSTGPAHLRAMRDATATPFRGSGPQTSRK